MKITKNTVATFFYSLKDEDGHELENNFDATPMAYLHGHSNIFAGLEAALEGLEVNDEKHITLTPSEAYGERKPDASQKVPIKHLLGKPKKLHKGQLVKINTEKGPRDGTVIKAGKFMVNVDFNHPLAGLSITFDVKIVDIRNATEEEVTHKHAHGVGGHHH